MDEKRIRQVANEIEKQNYVDMQVVFNPESDFTAKYPCGSPACVAGYTLSLFADPKFLKSKAIQIKACRTATGGFDLDRTDIFNKSCLDEAASLLHLSSAKADALFLPKSFDYTESEVVAVLRRMAKTGKVDWEKGKETAARKTKRIKPGV